MRDAIQWSGPRFNWFRQSSYNFLLLRHYGCFEAVSRTPQLEIFWGGTLGEWVQRRRHSVTVPLDPVLGGIQNSGIH